ncbi:MAG: MBL fold metallo-hydrolase [Clostridiaceae bacterium]|nr:MBL fold metallo-hydrolase [Clostridiales bacterium]MDD2440760.1 MBL fold metallo-hydrolase [Eubacteriales bacterium]MDD4140649.1 MBL fold metallo-hydrolase [Eubacteriales bacterium]MDD4744671.1 MBL fold metallo-hydrolase [Eubacteriales bacterium]NLB44655.1 MBL fold metallo-hydrolase [Clostridiaceae bacterium]
MEQDTKIAFLGTGAADWHGPDANGECRTFASVLVDGHILVDCTASSLIRMAEMGINPTGVTDILITHSHSDHFDPAAIRELARNRLNASGKPLTVHLEHSWSNQVHFDGAVVNGLTVETDFLIGSNCVTPLAANHIGAFPGEMALHFFFDKQDTRWLYATDGGWLLARTWHWLRQRSLECAVFDCTVGMGHAGDFRIFEHNALPMVFEMVAAMRRSQILKDNAPVILTHLARTLHPGQKQLESQLQLPFRAAYDGFILNL